MKKALTLIVTLAIVLSILPGFTIAQAAQLPQTSCAGSSKIVSDIQMKVLYIMVEVVNAQIEARVRQAQKTPYDDVDELLVVVDLLTRPVFAYAKCIGAIVVCEYTEYYIDGQYVLIDPLRVINI